MAKKIFIVTFVNISEFGSRNVSVNAFDSIRKAAKCLNTEYKTLIEENPNYIKDESVKERFWFRVEFGGSNCVLGDVHTEVEVQ